MHQKKLLYSFKSVDEIREARKRICSVSCFRLISLTAQSIHAVTSDRVFGLRMGGDEYVMVAVNVTQKETDEIYNGWKRSLEELNTQGNVYCVMACGLKYCEGEFDVEELFKQADELMYLDKKARKEKGETSHLRSES